LLPSLLHLAEISFKLQYYQESLTASERALALWEKSNVTQKQQYGPFVDCGIYLSLALSYHTLHNLEKAELYFIKCYEKLNKKDLADSEKLLFGACVHGLLQLSSEKHNDMLYNVYLKQLATLPPEAIPLTSSKYFKVLECAIQNSDEGLNLFVDIKSAFPVETFPYGIVEVFLENIITKDTVVLIDVKLEPQMQFNTKIVTKFNTTNQVLLGFTLWTTSIKREKQGTHYQFINIININS